MSCVVAGRWALETGLYVDGGAAVRKLRKRHAVKLADSTGKRNRHHYLKILPDWFEECRIPEMYGLYVLTSQFFHQLAWNMVIFSFNS